MTASRRRCRPRKVALYVSGDLPAKRAARLERHLASCTACRRLAEELRGDRLALARLAGERLDERALQRVRAGVTAKIDEPATARERGSRGTAWAPVAVASALILAALGLWLQAPGPRGLRDRGPAAPAARERVASRRPAEAAPKTPPARSPRGPARPSPGAAPRRHPHTGATPRPRSTGEGRRPARRASAPPSNTNPPSEPLVIQVVSEHPDIVYYWLAEPEETHHESSSE